MAPLEVCTDVSRFYQTAGSPRNEPSTDALIQCQEVAASLYILIPTQESGNGHVEGGV
jgi:hypothetical protein